MDMLFVVESCTYIELVFDYIRLRHGGVVYFCYKERERELCHRYKGLELT